MNDEALANFALLKSLVYAGAEKKNLPLTNIYLDRIAYELNIIRTQKFTDYFVIYARIIEIINELNIIRSPGRNTAPCSLVNYCLDITKIDPIAEGLMFERFVLPCQQKTPDIDIDVQSGTLDDIIAGLHRKYPQYNTFFIASLAQSGQRYKDVFYNGVQYQNRPGIVIVNENKKIQDTFMYEGRNYCLMLHGSDDPIFDDKLDILELPYLSRLQSVVHEVGEAFHPYNLPLDDKHVFEFFASGDLQHIFQFSLPGLKKIMAKFKPASIHDLALVNAMYRPGIVRYIPTVIRGKEAMEDLPVLSSNRVFDIFKESYGLLIYQESFLLLLHEVSGLSFSEAEQWRKKIIRDKTGAELRAFQTRFIIACEKCNKIEDSEIDHFADMVTTMLPFTFPKAHALSYATVSYWGAYYKVYFPQEFNRATNLTG